MIKGFLNLDGLDVLHNDQHRKLFTFGFPLIEKVTTTAPTLTTLPVGYGQFYESGTTKKLFYNLNGTLIYTTWTNA